MSRWLRFGLSVLFVLAVLPPARADIAAPFPGQRPGVRPNPFPGPGPGPGPFPGPGILPAAQKTKLVIEIDNTIRVARLQIPMKLAVPGGGGGIAPPAPPAQPRRSGIQGADAGPRRMPTIVAGAALALTFTSGGFWLVRRRSGSRTVPFLVALLALGISGTVLWANGVFPGPRPNPGLQPPAFPNPPAAPAPAALPQLILPADIRLDSNLIVEFTNDDGDAVKLIVNPVMVRAKTGVRKPPANGGGRKPINVPRPPIQIPING